MELKEREKNIVNLINNLSEVANDKETTREAIDRILGQIRKETSENIKEELSKTHVPVTHPEFPDEKFSSEFRKAMAEEHAEVINELKGIVDGHNHCDSCQPVGNLVFTRIREVKSPCKAHPTDAGIDFFVPDAKAWTDDYKAMVRTYSKNPNQQDLVFIGVNGVEVAAGSHVAIPSGIKTIIPVGLAMMMVNKSGVATKLKLDHSACLIDSEYRDELIFCFFNHNVEPVKIEPGMKLTQGLIVPVINLDIQEVLNCVYDDMGKETDRGGGFGSSGQS